MAISEYTRVPVSQIEESVAIRFPALRIEIVLYVGLALAALFVRLLLLDYPPLSTPEAMQAVASWHWVNGTPDSFTGSPLLFGGNALLFALFGATDFAARVIPAVFGSALVLLPALLRRELGRTGALVASLLLLLSPSLVFFSRQVDGVVIGVTCALAALAWVWRYVADRVSRDLNLAAVAAALALISAREVWTIVLSMTLFVAFLWFRERGTAPAADVADGPIHVDQVEQQRRQWLIAGALFACVFIGVSTALLLHRDGLGAALALFGAWIGGLQPGGSFFDPLRLLVVYEPITLFFGVVALVDIAFAVTSWERDHAPLFALGILIVTAFVLYSIGADKNPARIVVLVIPLSLVAGSYIGSWLEEMREQVEVAPQVSQIILTQEVPIYLFACALAGFLYIILAEFTTRGSVLAADMLAAITRQPPSAAMNGIVLTGLVAVAIAVVVFLAVSTVGWARARIIGTAVVLTLLTGWTIRQTTLVNFSTSLNPQEWVISTAASANVRDMVRDLEDISRWRANDSHAMTMIVDASLGPMAEWYLRDFRNAQFVLHPTMQPKIEALVLSPDTPVNAGNLMSQRYILESVRAPAAQPNLLRWLLFRDVGGVTPSQAVVWVPQPQ